MADLTELSKRERQIMDIVYAHGEVTATQVLEAIPETLSRAAIRTFLRILEEKGHLTHRQVGREYVFKPTKPRRRAGQSALKRVLDVFFHGSMEKAVAAYLADRGDADRDEDLEKISALIRQARDQGR